MTARLRLAVPVLLAVLLFSGCGGEVGLALAGASAVSFATTDKFLSDHVVSAVTGEECSSLQLEQTGEFCRTPEEIAADQTAGQERRADSAEMYCYRTLGKITCYNERDYQATLAQQVR